MSDPRPVDFRVVIPARFGSSRLPGKPLLPIAGKPLVVHVLDRARAAGAREVVVATDDQRIVEAVQQAGGEVELTRADHPSGTDRIAEVAERRGWGAGDIIVNVQGDEPLIPSALVRQLAVALHGRADLHMATVATPLRAGAELTAASVVKVVTRADGRALYFSRAPIPWVRDEFRWGDASLPLSTVAPPLRHIGLYAYRVATLQQLTTSAVAPMEAAESLEQLRALWLGLEIQVLTVAEAPTHGVDTPEDLERVRLLLEAGGG